MYYVHYDRKLKKYRVVDQSLRQVALEDNLFLYSPRFESVSLAKAKNFEGAPKPVIAWARCSDFVSNTTLDGGSKFYVDTHVLSIAYKKGFRCPVWTDGVNYTYNLFCPHGAALVNFDKPYILKVDGYLSVYCGYKTEEEAIASWNIDKKFRILGGVWHHQEVRKSEVPGETVAIHYKKGCVSV